jgi:uncharacterized protein with PQ loop repeat
VLLDDAPLAAAVFAIPQFLPQIARLRATEDTAGVSWSWSALTSVDNCAWLAYFVLSGYWTALVPSCSATVLAAVLAAMLTARRGTSIRAAAPIAVWAGVLVLAGAVGGRAGLGTLLTAAFALQVTPSLWTAYRTDEPTGVSLGTWLLVLGELSCWEVYGLHRGDPRLIVLGLTGIVASLLMLARVTEPSWPPRRRVPG